jgi:hypothetical protein
VTGDGAGTVEDIVIGAGRVATGGCRGKVRGTGAMTGTGGRVRGKMGSVTGGA